MDQFEEFMPDDIEETENEAIEEALLEEDNENAEDDLDEEALI